MPKLKITASLWFAGGVFALSLLTSTAHSAEPWPSRPITLYVPFAAGGPTDIFSRTVAAEMSKRLGQAVVVENKTGAGGNIATTQFLQAKPDGYTLLTGASYLLVSPYLYRTITYDLTKDFTPVGPPVESHLVFVGNPHGPSLKQMLEAAETTKQPIKLASPGAGTLSHLGSIALGQSAKAPMTHVSYRGIPPALTDIMAGNVDLLLDGISSSLPLIKAGRLKALAVPAAARDPLLPEVPTLSELGYADLDVLPFNALFANPKTPPEVLQKLDSVVRAVFASTEIKTELESRGLYPTTLTVEQFRQRMSTESQRWKHVIEAAGITAN